MSLIDAPPPVAKNIDSTRAVRSLSQLLHAITLSASRIGRSASNLV
jgi:hypothetical protein